MQEEKIHLHEKTSHGKPGFGMVVYKNDFSTYLNHTIPWHWHEEIEFVVVTEGHVHFSVAGDAFTLTEGEGIFINANSLHHMQPAVKDNAYMFSVLIHPGMLSAHQGYLLDTEFVKPYIHDAAMPYHILKKENASECEILSQLTLFDQIFFAKKPEYEYRLFSLGADIWYSCMQSFWSRKPEEFHKTDTDLQRIYQSMEFIHQHYQESISLNDICQASAISRSECCRCFQRNLKMSPFAYLTTYRIGKAAELLRSTDDSLRDIAISSGFNDDSYFCKIFKRNIGCTPLAYRKNKGVEHGTGTEEN